MSGSLYIKADEDDGPEASIPFFKMFLPQREN
jgi:hypothetical protein